MVHKSLEWVRHCDLMTLSIKEAQIRATIEEHLNKPDEAKG